MKTKVAYYTVLHHRTTPPCYTTARVRAVAGLVHNRPLCMRWAASDLFATCTRASHVQL